LGSVSKRPSTNRPSTVRLRRRSIRTRLS
jgi:hypothetical protein